MYYFQFDTRHGFDRSTIIISCEFALGTTLSRKQGESQRKMEAKGIELADCFLFQVISPLAFARQLLLFHETFFTNGIATKTVSSLYQADTVDNGKLPA